MPQYKELDAPIRRIALFSSGVGYFEHTAKADGDVRLTLPFQAEEISDVLKSLTILDPGCPTPAVTYPAENTVSATLKSLKPDLTGSPDLMALLSGLRGALIEVNAGDETLTGRILSAEERDGGEEGPERYLSLVSDGAVQVLPVRSVRSYRFLQESVTLDIERALELLFSAATERERRIVVSLPSHTNREIALRYVIGAPVWKSSYRIDLSETDAFLQGWAIIDNASDTDWKDAEVSLIAGRPASFTQNLYAPYFLARKEVPLNIAGSAEVRTYEDAQDRFLSAMESSASEDMAMPSAVASLARRAAPTRAMNLKSVSGSVQTAQPRATGEQFSYTLAEPLTLERRRSAMVPLAQGTIEAKKVLVFSAAGLGDGVSVSPALGLEIRNTLGASLPAGPVTITDDGLYAGDALLEFLPDGDKRYLSYGDDIAVKGSYRDRREEVVSKVSVSRGVLTATLVCRRSSKYLFTNASPRAKRLVLEHPVSQGEELKTPEQALERTPSQLRFEIMLDASGSVPFTAVTERTVYQRLELSGADREAILFWTAREIEPAAKVKLEQAAGLLRETEQLQEQLDRLGEEEKRSIEEQRRIRENIAAVGAGTRSGASYTNKLAAAEEKLEQTVSRIDAVRKSLEKARSSYTQFIEALKL